MTDKFSLEVIAIPCYHPMKAIRKKGSNQYRMIKFDQSKGRDFVPFIDYDTGELVEPIELPCGRCIGCRLEHSRQWANRNVLESLAYPEDQCWFLTLTIDDEHLKEYINERGFASVHNDDISTFMKALRGRWSEVHGVTEGIRFFAASEYGGKSMRPHYHILVYGLPLYDLEFYKNNSQGDALFKSEELDMVWQRGFVTIGEFNWNTAAYTARYVMKKADGLSPAVYDDLGIEPEKTRMSRKPGIGYSFFEKYAPEFYDLDEIVLPSKKGKANVISVPKFFDKKVKQFMDEGLEFKTASGRTFGDILDERKRVANLRQQIELQSHGYDPHEYYSIKEDHKKNILRSLQRGLDI